MVRLVFILFFVLWFSFDGYSQSKSSFSFIPKDYDTLLYGVAKGDINKDGIEDVVLALYHKMEQSYEEIDTDSIPPRRLIILFGSKNGYSKVAESSVALLCKSCGGMYGDPFVGIEINKNVLTIYHYGGSAWRWSYKHKFQIRNGVLSLIGRTHEYYYNAGDCEKLDYPQSYEMKDEN